MEEISRNNQLPGERFCPMDDELLLFYLKPMLSGRQNVRGLNKVVFDCDLYGSQEPWEIWETYKTERPNDLRLNQDLYFFTRHKNKSSTDKRISRNVGRGTWRGNDSGKPIKYLETGRKIGSKKRFTYENEASEHHGCWIMHEFYLDPSVRDKKQKANKDYVLCVLRKNVETKAKNEKKRRQREEEALKIMMHVMMENNRIRSKKSCLSHRRSDNEPTPSEEVDAFAAELEESLPCVQDDNAPFSDVEVNAYAAKLQESLFQDDNAPPSEAEAVGFQGVGDVGLQQLASEVQSGPFAPLPEDNYVKDEGFFEGILNYVEKEGQDPAGSKNLFEGLIDFDDADLINSIRLFSPEANSLFSSEMPSPL